MYAACTGTFQLSSVFSEVQYIIIISCKLLNLQTQLGWDFFNIGKTLLTTAA